MIEEMHQRTHQIIYDQTVRKVAKHHMNKGQSLYQ